MTEKTPDAPTTDLPPEIAEIQAKLATLEGDDLLDAMETVLKQVIVKALIEQLTSAEGVNASLLGHADRYLARRKGSANEDDDSIIGRLRKKAERAAQSAD